MKEERGDTFPIHLISISSWNTFSILMTDVWMTSVDFFSSLRDCKIPAKLEKTDFEYVHVMSLSFRLVDMQICWIHSLTKDWKDRWYGISLVCRSCPWHVPFCLPFMNWISKSLILWENASRDRENWNWNDWLRRDILMSMRLIWILGWRQSTQSFASLSQITDIWCTCWSLSKYL